MSKDLPTLITEDEHRKEEEHAVARFHYFMISKVSFY